MYIYYTDHIFMAGSMYVHVNQYLCKLKGAFLSEIEVKQ